MSNNYPNLMCFGNEPHKCNCQESCLDYKKCKERYYEVWFSFMEDANYFEAVEVCPHCLQENVYPMWKVEENGFVAPCRGCGSEILLCDECMYLDKENGATHDCDWCGGKCRRGVTKN